MKIKIYNCYHTSQATLSDSIIIPIQLGRTLSDFKFEAIGDDTGDNISEKSPFFSELTAQYWAWKNDKESDWIGLIHHRRYLDFRKNNNVLNEYGCVQIQTLSEEKKIKYGISDRQIRKIINSNKDCLAILPKKWNVTSTGHNSIYNHYKKSRNYFVKDLEIIRDIIKKRYPDYLHCYDSFLNSETGFLNNIFVLKRDLFTDYSEWLFDILFQAEKHIDTTYYSKNAKRVFAYISEILLNVYIEKNITNKRKSIIELDSILIQHTNTIQNIQPLHQKKSITVVTSSDNNFIPHLAAMLMSVQLNLEKESLLDFIILDGGISKHNKYLLVQQFHNTGFGRISFIDCKEYFANVELHMHFATPTFYRLALGELLPAYTKILYLDCDMIISCNLAELYATPLRENQAIAAVTDVMMKYFVANNIPSTCKAGGINAKEYLKQWIGLRNKYDSYFQAGVMLIDIVKYTKLNVHAQAIKMLNKKTYWFVDQDILNTILLGHVKFLDLRWNVLNKSLDARKGLHSDLKTLITESFAHPFIIHYAGNDAKPWKNKKAELSQYYWYYLRKTIWYDTVRYDSSVFGQAMITNLSQLCKKKTLNFLMIFWRVLPNYLQKKLSWLRFLLDAN